jgi:hypothetical protein
VDPRAGLDAVEMRKIWHLPGIEPQPFSPQPVAILIPSLMGHGVDIDTAWFQQDGVRPHTTNTVLDSLKENTRGRPKHLHPHYL